MKIVPALMLAVLAAPLAHAHVGVEPASAPAGVYKKFTFNIGHGCKGSPTHTVTVVLPDTVLGAKPMPKAGWTVTTTEAKLSPPVDVHGKPMASTVREISWKGGPLADAHYDEFSLQARTPDIPGKVYFKVTQLCDKGRWDWVDTPYDNNDMASPAPVLEVLPAAAPVHHH